MPKSPWTRLLGIITRKGDLRFTERRLSALFAAHHRYADELTYSRDGKLLSAVYYTPDGLNRRDAMAMLARIRTELDL